MCICIYVYIYIYIYIRIFKILTQYYVYVYVHVCVYIYIYIYKPHLPCLCPGQKEKRPRLPVWHCCLQQHHQKRNQAPGSGTTFRVCSTATGEHHQSAPSCVPGASVIESPWGKTSRSRLDCGRLASSRIPENLKASQGGLGWERRTSHRRRA